MKGIVLAGGSGTRLYPITEGISKQLMPIYDKPMIFYPVSVLMHAGIRDILLITTKEDQEGFKRLFGDGSKFGLNIEYIIQPSPDGLAQAFTLGEKFIGDDTSAMVLGDNIFYGHGFNDMLAQARLNAENGYATNFGYQVRDPQRFGIMELDENNNILSVEELNDRLIDLAFAEDIGDGDHTTLCCIPDTEMGESKLLIKEEGIFAGVEIAKQVFHRFDPAMQVEVFIQDGAHVKPGDIVMSVKGKVQSLLQTERLMLNILQRMSGIATMTHKYQQALIDAGTKTRVLDTRKTTPGMRMLEKEAVKIGGGMNHRIGLFDMILLKDNHIDFCGGVHNAISRAKQYCKEKGKNLKIECEVRNWKELDEALAEGCDRIMFDNFTPEDTCKAVQLVAGRCETESSGGITFDNMIPYAKAGVDFISFGALTHSVKGLDMSFKAAGSDKLKI